MPARRYKSIMHGSAEDTRVYHREHRSKKGRKNMLDIKQSNKFKKWEEDRVGREMDKEARKLLKLKYIRR